MLSEAVSTYGFPKRQSASTALVHLLTALRLFEEDAMDIRQAGLLHVGHARLPCKCASWRIVRAYDLLGEQGYADAHVKRTNGAACWQCCRDAAPEQAVPDDHIAHERNTRNTRKPRGNITLRIPQRTLGGSCGPLQCMNDIQQTTWKAVLQQALMGADHMPQCARWTCYSQHRRPCFVRHCQCMPHRVFVRADLFKLLYGWKRREASNVRNSLLY